MKKLTKEIMPFTGNLKCVKDIQLLIEKNYEELFIAVIVHGSVATNEIVNYSDFDGLLVVKDEFLESSKLSEFKRHSMKYIYQFDPLQHHGWFQLSESDLKKYPENYLPHEILEHSKLIYPSNEKLSLTINFYEESIDYKKSLNQLIANIEAQINLDWRSQRVYQLKSFLSKIMLLPSMYYSVKNSKGVFKRQSFNLTRSFFTDIEWNCLVTASEIRDNWDVKLNLFQNLIMTQPNMIFRKLTKKYVAPKIDNNVLTKLDDDFLFSLKLLLQKIKRDIFAF